MPVQPEHEPFTPQPPKPVVWPRESRLIIFADLLRGLGWFGLGLAASVWVIASVTAWIIT